MTRLNDKADEKAELVAPENAKPRHSESGSDVLMRRFWPLLTAPTFLIAVGLLFVVAGALSPLGEGEQRSWVPVLFGVQLAVLGSAMGVAVWSPRLRRPCLPSATVAPPATGGLVALPLRRVPRLAGMIVMGLAATLGVTLAVSANGVAVLLLGLAIIALFTGLATLLARTTIRGLDAIVLNENSVTLPAGRTPRTTVAWADLSEVTVSRGRQPELVVTCKGPGMSRVKLLPQAWPPSTLVEVLEFYQANPAARSQLTDPAALERFRRGTAT